MVLATIDNRTNTEHMAVRPDAASVTLTRYRKKNLKKALLVLDFYEKGL